MNERLPYLREKTSLLTTSPGVYRMRDKTGHIIYIGKAKNLRNRVTSYFCKSPDHTPKVAKMVSNVYDYDFIVTDSEYEALVLECSLIKQHKPKYNILLKDDKGYSYIKISKEEYPRITYELQKNGEGKLYRPLHKLFRRKPDRKGSQQGLYAPDLQKSFPPRLRQEPPLSELPYQAVYGTLYGKDIL